ncbi:MAG: alpha-L-rhamnosidase, partial [Thermoguttaceae bacterium]|nr:alpha-L-rhamnosidase [Thermoguttaceae bacterium]
SGLATGDDNVGNISLGGYVVDCPQRERMGYGGDAHATSESGMYNFALEAFYYNWMEDWRDCQKDYPDGYLPNTAPTYWGGGGTSWGGIVVTLPYTFYMQYGDVRILEENFPMIEKWLGYLDGYVKNDLLERYQPDVPWNFLGDWLWPGAPDGPNSDTPQALCLNNIYRVFNLRAAAKIASVIGKTERAQEWEAKAEASSKAIMAKYYGKDGKTLHDDAQAILGMALVAEIAQGAEADAIAKRLEDAVLIDAKGHVGAGITGGGMLFRYLRAANRDDLVYSMLKQTEYPGWGFMRAHDATTYWEAWELDRPGHSLLHSSYLFPVAWYVSNLLGIQRDPNVVAFKNFVVRPPKADETDLTFAKGHYDSIAGKIECAWEKTDSGMKMTVVVPPNTAAKIYVPKTAENGKFAAPNGATFVEDVPGFAVFAAPSGTFVFEETR